MIQRFLVSSLLPQQYKVTCRSVCRGSTWAPVCWGAVEALRGCTASGGTVFTEILRKWENHIHHTHACVQEEYNVGVQHVNVQKAFSFHWQVHYHCELAPLLVLRHSGMSREGRSSESGPCTSALFSHKRPWSEDVNTGYLSAISSSLLSNLETVFVLFLLWSSSQIFFLSTIENVFCGKIDTKTYGMSYKTELLKKTVDFFFHMEHKAAG